MRDAGYVGRISKLTSSACAECVTEPVERKSTPVSATARTLASVMPPDASVSARPLQSATR